MSLKQRLDLKKSPVYLVDGSSFLYRAFYAYPDLKRSDGFPTNALFILIRMLLKIIREESPKYMAFFLDGKGPTFRHELMEQYKANRPATPEDLVRQIEPVKRAVGLLGVSLDVSEGAEADDYICSLADRFKSKRPVIIVASDKDLNQCLDENVYLWDPAMKQEKLVTLEDFSEKYGFSPGQWADFQALTGDPSDNIPGVPGVGPKTAMKILEQCPTLEDVREHFHELPKPIRKKLEGRLDDLFLYRKLTRLKRDYLKDKNLDDLACESPHFGELLEFLKEFEFRSLASETARLFAARPGREVKTTTQTQGSLLDTGLEPGGPPKPENLSALPDLSGREVSVSPMEAGLRLGLDDKEFLWTGGPDDLMPGLVRADAVFVPSLKDLLASDKAFGREPGPAWFDIGLAAYLLSPEERDYGVDKIAARYFMELDPAHVSDPLTGQSVLRLGRLLRSKIEGAGLLKLMREVETPLIYVLARMEKRGVKIDRQAFAGFLDEVQKELDALTARIFELAGQEFNLRSSRQLGAVLFDKLGLKPAGKTPGGQASTSVHVLERMAHKHEIIADILDFRRLEKLRSTYLEPLPRLAGPNGRIHTTFNQLATATGRLSSSNPNLQNIPVRGPLGRRMRSCFTAEKGNLLVSADYSQVELRVLAHFSGEPALVDAFRHDRDIHSSTAGLLFDKPASEVTADERRKAKTINFGLIYGMGPQKLSRELAIPMTEAKRFIGKYFEKLSGLRAFYDRVLEEAARNRSVTTLAGRRRLLPEIASKSAYEASQAKRQAINTLIQGSAADIIKLAMLKVDADRRLRSLNAGLILQIHDELLMEVPAGNADETARIMEQIMTSVVELDVPLAVDLGLGYTWADAH